ncbi:TPA: hypothetical protein N0F65_005785 [Lagenidium giganteum]|uniref:HMA domain-containing protein n=1 Tax=Lagenidium giganteum TaxID=4803 RepID=A0AAV2YP21_9STRA|nr:TPA: hypothetical protein N0F65_005785 [Lagenidium giganteum]
MEKPGPDRESAQQHLTHSPFEVVKQIHPHRPITMSKVTEFKVGMTCDGCSSACTRILNKIDGVTDVKCDVEKQQILVTGTADDNTMLEALLKWSKASGKSVELVQ